MRLTCPNCGAEYEVPDDAIPDSGRDVQCSNCGHTWFEGGVAVEAEAEPEDLPEPPRSRAPAPAAPDPPRQRAGPVPDPDAPHPGVPEPDPEAPHPDPGQPAPRRRLDPDVASVLREERETSQALRQRPAAAPMERQEDLPLTEQPRPARPPVTAAPPRRDRLPDVEDLNRALEDAGTPPASDRTPAEQEALRYRQGFRYGFGIVALIAAAATMLYLYAPAIGAAVPALDPPLSAYDGAVDSLRLSLDGWVRSLTARLSADDPG